MLKKRSSTACSKQGLMSDRISLPSPTIKFRSRPTVSSLNPSPGFLGNEASVMITSSTLETKPFSAAGNHIFSDRKPKACSNNSSESKVHPWDVINSNKVGLGIVDALSNEKADKKSSKVESRMVLFGSQLKVQIPSTSQINSAFPTCSVVSPHSLIEFGVKNKNSKLAMALLSPERRCLTATTPTSKPPQSAFCLSPSEMELSEDYTRVISHGPNPRTIHIFDTCTLENCNNVLSPSRREIKFSIDGSSKFPSVNSLSFYQSCRKKIVQGKDIFMYRGEKVFCSYDCGNREMVLDDETENLAQQGPPPASP
ncbi:FCS-Like Zinc finger 8 [Dendrobium catenatum]|uniref:FLZ-type domain-containing protein n=1 Tax=Dendrobium catenatum TaxID=906689 RepID=A0A2I0XIW4_9ASPA|nr:FCS-Like Zinc finger 8 [Dendrobium catenatum]PKU87863.1 hypothetical protein MA16_Dca027233 [Dendrobium catenatum]